MGKKKLDVMAKERENFVHGKLDDDGNIEIQGCVRNGIDEASANKIFDEKLSVRETETLVKKLLREEPEKKVKQKNILMK